MKNPKLETNLKDTYSESFFSQHDRSFYPVLAASILEILGDDVKSVLDVGCGHGFLVESFRALGLTASGIEGSESAQSLWPTAHRDSYLIRDLTRFQDYDQIAKTDLVCSFEVAEHVPEEFAGDFIRVLTHSRPKQIVFGAATEFQDLDKNPTHVNERPFQYWIQQMETAGYELDIVNTVALKELLFARKRTDGIKWWYPKNAMVYVPRGTLELREDYDQQVVAIKPGELTWRIRSGNPVFNLMADRDRYEYLYLIESKIGDSRAKIYNASKPRPPLYVATIDTTPEYKICWYKDQPRNLQKLIPSVEAGHKVRIGDYCDHYRNFFNGRSSNEYMIDIGANIGLSAFPVASLGHPVICFEPTEVNIELLSVGIACNNFKQSVRIEEVALSDKDQSIKIYVPEGRADNASLDKDCSNLNLQANPARSSTISAMRFDNWWSHHNAGLKIEQARLFKVDTQGHELSVLIGATEFLSAAAEYGNLILEIEWDSGFLHARNINGTDLLHKIDALGFEVYAPARLTPDEFVDFAGQSRKCDLLCQAKTKHSL